MKRIIHEVIQRSERWMLIDDDGNVRELLRRELPELADDDAPKDGAAAPDAATDQLPDSTT
jgi:hypothetical protein